MTKICIELPTDPGYGVEQGGQSGQLPVGGGGRPGQGLPSAPGHPDNGLPWVPGHPDNGLPPTHGRPDNDLPWVPGRPDNELPPVQGLPDNALPGVDWPVDPGYGIDAPSPGTPDNTLPAPTPKFSTQEKAHIRALATAKFINTDLPAMRCLVQSARFVLLFRQRSPTAQPK